MKISSWLGGLTATSVFVKQYASGYGSSVELSMFQGAIAGFVVFIICVICSFLIKLIKAGFNKAKQINSESFVVPEGKSSEAVNKKRRSAMLQNWYNSMTPMQVKFLWIVSFLLVFIYGIGLIPLALLIYLKLGNQRV
ncbi:MAG: hypothetical protein LBB91_05215 [Clostridiales bacterium]|nr:hypothetical protein [Clostridiales bacterium]